MGMEQTNFAARLMKILRDRRGAAAIEYALIASLISIAIITGLSNTGDKVEAKFNSVNAAME